MKHLFKLVFVVPILVLVAFGLLIGGSMGSNDAVANVGKIMLTLVIPILAVTMVGIGLAVSLKGKGANSDNKKSAGQSNNIAVDDLVSKQDPTDGEAINLGEKEREITEIEGINKSHGYDSKIKEAEFIARHSANIYKNSSKGEKIKSTLFLAFLLINFALIFVFGFLQIISGVIVCMCLFAGTIIVCMIVRKVSEKLSMRNIDLNSGKYEIVCGEVKNSFLSSTTSTGGKHGSSNITGVVYRVIVSANEQEFIAYSREYRASGEVVMIAILGKRRASIVDGDELLEKFDDSSIGASDDKDENVDNISF